MDLAFCSCGCSYNFACDCDNIKSVSVHCDFVCVLECHKIAFHSRNHFVTVEILGNRRHLVAILENRRRKFAGLFIAFYNLIQVLDNEPSVQINGDHSAIWIVGWRYILSFNEGYLLNCVIYIAQLALENNRHNCDSNNRSKHEGDDYNFCCLVHFL